MIDLWKVTGHSSYRQKVKGLPRHFKKHLEVDSSGGYVWDYWYGKGLRHYNAREDISHAAIDVDFAVRAGRVPLVFSCDDLVSFTLAFTRETRTSGGNMLDANDAAGRWFELAGTDYGVYRASFLT